MWLQPADKGSTLVWADCQCTIECSSMSFSVLSTTVYRLLWDTKVALQITQMSESMFSQEGSLSLISVPLNFLIYDPRTQVLILWDEHKCHRKHSSTKESAFWEIWSKNCSCAYRNIFMWAPWKICLSLTGLNLFLLTGSGMIFQSVSRVARVIAVFAGCQEIGRMNHPDLMRSIKLLHILHTTCCAKGEKKASKIKIKQ